MSSFASSSEPSIIKVEFFFASTQALEARAQRIAVESNDQGLTNREVNMAFVGNRKGPRESEIVSRFGPAYFGITQAALDDEIESWYLPGEMNGEIAPVRRDGAGRYYIRFSAPNGGYQNFYLDEHGLKLEGEVRIWEEDAKSVYVKP